MAEYIDAAKLKAHYAWWGDFDNLKEQKQIFDTIIDLQPVEEFEPVTRCRECVFAKEYRLGIRCERLWRGVEPDFFCAYAIRRDDWDKRAELGILPPGGTIPAEYADRGGEEGEDK